MKFPFLLILFHLPLLLCGQAALKGPWKIECGVSTNNALKPSGFNLRYISPRFKWPHKDYYREEKEKDPEKFKNGRIMVELIYTPPFKVFCTSLNVQSRFVNYKRLSIDAYGGVKFFFVRGPDFKNIQTGKKDIRFLNMGLLFQFNLGVIAPFVDFSSDSIITIGTELDLHAVYRKPKRRYNLPSQQ